jgi:hypothetical protein
MRDSFPPFGERAGVDDDEPDERSGSDSIGGGQPTTE